ncbi:hypothetical protein AUC31_11925 [Planococcus rifietoensis]|uniref:Peptidase MA-like domain-containing protein n=1 Tax=Planococcus rifietoensis TaxID=200991 RepID=A0A0U2XG62_9BACL|nr:hypothetical protein [Planococcus rifietoensis]ALS75855.1 hypothetical protein AUC31_11925 [Planococcus rifietoensis]
MHILKNIILSFLGLFLLTGGFGVLLLYLDVGQSLIAWLGVSVFVIAGIVLAIVWIAKAGDSKKKITNAVFLIASSILFWIFTLFLFATNFLLYDVEYDMTEATELTPEEKVTYYRRMITGEDDSIDLATLDSKEINGITFYFAPGSEPLEEMELLVGLVETNRPQLQHELGGETDAPVSFVLYGENLDMPIRETIEAEYSGFYKEHDQTIHLPLPIDKVSAMHEYTHHLFFGIAEERGMYSTEIPVWFIEGVATYLSEKEQGLPFNAHDPYEHVAFENLENPGGWENHLSDPFNPYIQSRAFLEFVLEEEGESVLPGIFAEMEHSSFESSFKKATGKTLESYEAKFFVSFEQLSDLWKRADLLAQQQGKSEEALEIFLEIAESAPNLETLNHQIASQYRELGDYENTNLYRQNELRLVNPESITGVSSAYNYITQDLLFTDVSEALKYAEMGVDSAGEWERAWSEKLFAEVSELANDIESGQPLEGYRGVLEGEDTVTALFSTNEKANLIDVVLARYPEDLSANRTALIELKEQFEAELAAQQ